MHYRQKLIALGASALLAAAVSLPAQTTSPSSPSSVTPRTPPGAPTPPPVNDDERTLRTPPAPQTTRDLSPDGLGVGSGSTQGSATTNNTSSGTSSSSSNATLSSPSGSSSASPVIGSTATSAATAQADAQVTSMVQQIDQQGPAVVSRAVTQFSDVTCTEENARALMEGLRRGTAVTLTGEDGTTATFTPTGRLGYGEAYLALALATEALKQNGITGCATPAQWRAVLLGGPLSGSTSASTTTTASSSSRATSTFPGILTLRTQGQGWGQIARTSQVQLGTVVSRARSSLNLTSESDRSSALGSSSSELSPRHNATWNGTITSNATSTGNSTSTGNNSTRDSRRNNSDTLGSASGSSGATEIGSSPRGPSTEKSDRTSPRNPNADEKSKNATDQGSNADNRNPKAGGSGKINDSRYDWEDRGDPKDNEKRKKEKKNADDPRS
jgi:hypothetical protein